MNNPHALIDLETLGTGDNAMIIQLAIVLFWPDKNLISRTEGALALNIRHDSANMGVADAPTIAWWMEQDDRTRKWVFEQDTEGRRMLFDRDFGEKGPKRAPPGAVFLNDALYKVGRFLEQNKVSHLWGAMDFDQRILRQAYARCGMEWPLGERMQRDFRTLRDLAPILGVEEPLFVGTRHLAIDDAFHDAGWAILILRRAAQVRTMMEDILLSDRSRPYMPDESLFSGIRPSKGKCFKTPKEIAREFLVPFQSSDTIVAP